MTALTITRDDQVPSDSHGPPVVAGSTSGSGHTSRGVQISSAAAGPDLPTRQGSHDAHDRLAGGNPTWNGSAATIDCSIPKAQLSLADPFLALAADVLDDAERNRIANENRLRQLTRSETDSDGEERGFGLDETHPDVARLAAIVGMLEKVEHQASLNLQRMLRAHALGPWVKAQKGVGDKQAARLLAVIGDPYLGPDGQPRTVSQLWSYCGHGDPSRKRRKGMTQDDLFALGNPVAKSRVWLISCAVLKSGGGEQKATAVPVSTVLAPSLAAVYYRRKAATVGRAHAADCVRCGPSGKPALVGTPWSDAHRHADALRVLGKTILRDLWIEARRIHESENY
ncbi:hypothetical protein RB608_11775 [Nocardioides sp. LHD-245]|uniref:hypothetical protein n=1 Tax=Nocardioides sp. LHD-245 TaxID=3051387 RepID=UPI0027E1FDE2|nr:hypothetical protein [Nocardioides sp. LHD-245]